MSVFISREEAEQQIRQSRTLAEVKTLISREGLRLWLVGGWVRDFFMGRGFSDVDMIVDTRESSQVQRYVAKLAERLGGSVVALDKERGYWRLANVPQDHLDFAARQADTIEEDLKKRDFTINAVAWDVLGDEFVDPWGGIADCQRGVLRALSEDNLAADPLRNLRAWRFLCTRCLVPSPELEGQIRRQVPALRQIAGERVNEELSRIFAGDIVGQFDFALRSGIFAALWPELAANAVHIAESLKHWKLWKQFPWGKRQTWEQAERKYWEEPIRCGRSRYMLLGLALLLGGGRVQSACKAFRNAANLDSFVQRFSLSRKERKIINLIGLHSDTAEMLLQGQSLREKWFDFFRSTGCEAAVVLLYAWLSQPESLIGQSLPGNGSNMLKDFFENGSAYCPQVPLAVKLLLEKYPQLQGAKIGELTDYLARASAVRGGLTEEQAWQIAGDFINQFK